MVLPNPAAMHLWCSLLPLEKDYKKEVGSEVTSGGSLARNTGGVAQRAWELSLDKGEVLSPPPSLPLCPNPRAQLSLRSHERVLDANSK